MIQFCETLTTMGWAKKRADFGGQQILLRSQKGVFSLNQEWRDPGHKPGSAY